MTEDSFGDGGRLRYDFFYVTSVFPRSLIAPKPHSVCGKRYKHMLIGGLAPCHNTLQAACMHDKIKRLDAILKSIRKQERNEKTELRLSTRRSRKMTCLGSQFISLSVKGNQFLWEIGRQFKHFYSFTKVWKFPVKEWGFYYYFCTPDIFDRLPGATIRGPLSKESQLLGCEK